MSEASVQKVTVQNKMGGMGEEGGRFCDINDIVDINDIRIVLVADGRRGITMWSWRLRLLPVLCLTLVGCIDTPAGKAVTADEGGEKPHLSRGCPRNGYLWVVSPDVLAKWVREIPEIAKGTSGDEVIKRLGEPDLDYICGPDPGPFSSDAGYDRWVVYYVAMDRDGAGILNDIESIALVFGPDNRYKTFWVENPLHHHKLSTIPGAPITADQLFDHDLTSLMLAGPAACTFPTASQPAP
jgi:hypothetical protein